MIKIKVIFKNGISGISVIDLGCLNNLIKKYGGEWMFVPMKNEETQNISDYKQRDVIMPSHHCECGAKDCITICTECGGYLE